MFCNIIDTTTFVLYDFNLNLNDSIALKTTVAGLSTCDTISYWYKVTYIDTINMLGTRKRLKLEVINPNQLPTPFQNTSIIYWYDGLGSNLSPIYNEFLLTDGGLDFSYYQSLCAIDTNETRILDLGCVYLSNYTKFDPKISFYPNPAINKLIIENQEVKDLNLQILDLNGTLFLENQIIRSYKEIDVNSLKNGVYILRIKQEDKVINKKLVIQRD